MAWDFRSSRELLPLSGFYGAMPEDPRTDVSLDDTGLIFHSRPKPSVRPRRIYHIRTNRNVKSHSVFGLLEDACGQSPSPYLGLVRLLRPA